MDLEPNYVDIEDFTQIKKLSDEKELVGIYISSHPLVQYRNQLRENGYISLNHAETIETSKSYKSAVIIQGIKTIRTKRGEPMAFLTVSDETEDMDAVVFPELYRKESRYLVEEELIFISGKIETRNGKKQWLLSSIEPFDENKLDKEVKQRLFIKTTEQTSKEALPVILKIAKVNPGSTPVIIYYEEQKKTYQLSKDYFIHVNRDALNSLIDYFGKSNVVYERK